MKSCTNSTNVVLRILVLVSLLFCAIYSQESNVKRIIIDQAGRKVSIPKDIKLVYSTSPMAQIMMYTLAPSKLAGLVFAPSEQERKYLTADFLKKPVLGGWYGKNTTGNPEAIINAKPDIIISMGDIDQTNITFSDRMQKQLNIPVIMIDGKLRKSDIAYRFLGDLIGEKARADTLAIYCQNVNKRIDNIICKIPNDKKVRVYYAEGREGLETDVKGSLHAELLDIGGGINVADVPNVGGAGRASVSFEQLLIWKPDVIIVCIDNGVAQADQNFNDIITSNKWKNFTAVANRKVFKIPSVPFGWFDRPPSVNRLIGIQWIVQLLYPQESKIDIRMETKNFYKLFYHRQITDKELNEILDHALPW